MISTYSQKNNDAEFVDPDSQAIIPIPENQLSAAVAPPKRKYQQRSSELVRVMDLGVEDQRYFRDVIPTYSQKKNDAEFVDPDSQAIVPVPENQLSAAIAPPKQKYQQRSSELVQVMDLGVEDQRYFRDVVRTVVANEEPTMTPYNVEEDKRFQPHKRRDLVNTAFLTIQPWMQRDSTNGQKGYSNWVLRKPSLGGFSLRNRRSSLKMIQETSVPLYNVIIYNKQ
ncbi:hypothetical protein LOK49_LG08G01800 [Camellia lanceoleosa]|uniref:Uncharacterized protein n=1 Tax=Camellia lanceoleosa TaxID=1840588 RepID=A0ACC0GYB8_9ERIC|nr:hypothetical protein LOK49_LG08G01800 [Camellia lanceoleosa]